MKKQLKTLSILILLSSFVLTSEAQTNFNMGVGYITQKVITGQIGLNYELHRISFGGEIRPSITRSVDAPQLFGFRAAVNLFNEADAYYTSYSIIPFIGYYYNKFSDSKLTKGEWLTGYGIRAYKMMNDIGAVYIEPMYIKNNFSLQAGMLFKFN